MPKPYDLTGRTALVTGSSRGIGAAIARGLADCGANVAVHYTGNMDKAREVAGQVAARGVKSCVVQGDLTADDGARKVFEGAKDALGHLDILVSNASVQEPCNWQEITRESFDRQVAANFRSALELIQLVAPGMIKRQWGRIVTIGSVQEAKPHPQMVVYAALKSAQTALVRNLAKQFAPHGVMVNSLAPGVINTDRSAARLEDPVYREKVLGWIPSGYVGTAEDCVAPVLLLCSQEARYITGANLFVDGGMSL